MNLPTATLDKELSGRNLEPEIWGEATQQKKVRDETTLHGTTRAIFAVDKRNEGTTRRVPNHAFEAWRKLSGGLPGKGAREDSTGTARLSNKLGGRYQIAQCCTRSSRRLGT